MSVVYNKFQDAWQARVPNPHKAKPGEPKRWTASYACRAYGPRVAKRSAVDAESRMLDAKARGLRTWNAG